MKAGIIGFGRMGKQIAKRLLEEKIELVCAFDLPGHPDHGKDIGLIIGVEQIKVKLESSETLKQVIQKTKPDVMIDFSLADACVNNAKIIAENKINLVIGTTGFKEYQLKDVKTNISKNSVGAVISPNMSIGVNVFWKIVTDAAKLLKDYDIEIIEAHHIFKKDAPSGTALKTAELVAGALDKSVDNCAVYGRHGSKERKNGEIGIHSIRAGDIIGEHTVLFATQGERIEITHRAHSRDAFVNGVIKAVKFVNGRIGIYDMSDVLKLNG